MFQPMGKAMCLVRGSINIDDFFYVKNIVTPGETISSERYERRAGGKGANQASAVAKAGGSVALVGGCGVVVEWVTIIPDQPTGRAIIQVSSEGENLIVLLKGANFVPICVPLQTIFNTRPITHVLLQNEIPWHDTPEYLEAANTSHVTTIFNPSPLPLREEITNFPWSELDWLIINQTEARGILESFGSKPTTELVSCPQSLDDAPQTARTAYTELVGLRTCPTLSSRVNIVCTLGPDGVLAMISGAHAARVGTPNNDMPHSHQDADSFVLYVPAAQLEGDVRDSTGAGDCFAGYLVASLMNIHERHGPGYKISQDNARTLLRRCVQAAGMSVERRGAMESQPNSLEVDERLQKCVY
ncbi:Ribokinase-like protein [Rickenella mellea]|uniref:Ribokinase n=1 Tax=Rickenella mellea TaxID=50990 RepID=A0A4Y7QK40_9AGAM|nr:Ribokinase-like protein [Rickenella mellea]